MPDGLTYLSQISPAPSLPPRLRFAPKSLSHPKPVRSLPGLFGITSNTLPDLVKSPSGPSGGASDGYELGRGAAGPERRCTTTAAGALRVIV